MAARRALARGLAPDARVDAVMTMPVVTIDADLPLHAEQREEHELQVIGVYKVQSGHAQ